MNKRIRKKGFKISRKLCCSSTATTETTQSVCEPLLTASFRIPQPCSVQVMADKNLEPEVRHIFPHRTPLPQISPRSPKLFWSCPLFFFGAVISHFSSPRSSPRLFPQATVYVNLENGESQGSAYSYYVVPVEPRKRKQCGCGCCCLTGLLLFLLIFFLTPRSPSVWLKSIIFADDMSAVGNFGVQNNDYYKVRENIAPEHENRSQGD